MRISDWSSDVCSSDLAIVERAVGERIGRLAREPVDKRANGSFDADIGRCRVLHRGPQRRTDLRPADHPIAAPYRHASGDVFKLADIAWPVVRFEHHARGGVELLARSEEPSCREREGTYV